MEIKKIYSHSDNSLLIYSITATPDGKINSEDDERIHGNMAKIHKSIKKEPDLPNAIITEVEDEDDEIEEFVPMTRCQI